MFLQKLTTSSVYPSEHYLGSITIRSSVDHFQHKWWRVNWNMPCARCLLKKYASSDSIPSDPLICMCSFRRSKSIFNMQTTWSTKLPQTVVRWWFYQSASTGTSIFHIHDHLSPSTYATVEFPKNAEVIPSVDWWWPVWWHRTWMMWIRMRVHPSTCSKKPLSEITSIWWEVLKMCLNFFCRFYSREGSDWGQNICL